MRIAYSIAQKAEAVALVRVVGAEAAAQQLGIARTTLVKWTTLAGHRPEIDTDGWQGLHDLAVAKTTAAVASGSLPARTVAVIAGIAARNLRAKPTPPAAVDDQEEPETASDVARDALWAWLDSLPDDQSRWIKRWVAQGLRDELHRRRLAEDDGAQTDSTPPVSDEPDERMVSVWQRLRAFIEPQIPEIVQAQKDREALEVARNTQRAIAARFLTDDEADLLIAAEKYLEEIA